MEAFWGCAAALVVLAPLILLIIGTVELHKLKAAVRNLVQRVGELESRSSSIAAPAAKAAEEGVKAAAAALGGKGGGGRPDMAQAGGPDGAKADAALAAIASALGG